MVLDRDNQVAFSHIKGSLPLLRRSKRGRPLRRPGLQMIAEKKARSVSNPCRLSCRTAGSTS
ncbi:hypothetical protein GGD55_004623 [Rhizobium giardinii]|uniref:Uncharacterized protein n=1 Tax=Rhizobium giardinii TaxID=56731 RepID=A0A7W8XAP1_9HYPH|nr:hypothetical protein [Rhizobium giardinii]